MARFADEAEQLVEILVESAGKDPIQDSYFRGVITGLRALTRVEWEDK